MLVLYFKCYITFFIFKECTISSSLWHRNAPLSIPRELVFNTTLSSHRRIIRKLLEQPSTLSRRIQWLSSYLMDDKVNRIEKNHVLNLILDHIPLINLYLLSTPVSRLNSVIFRFSKQLWLLLSCILRSIWHLRLLSHR